MHSEDHVVSSKVVKYLVSSVTRDANILQGRDNTYYGINCECPGLGPRVRDR